MRLTDNDLLLLARLINGEARGESYLGQVAVGAVVVNRLKSDEFPDTVAGVVYQPGQFAVRGRPDRPRAFGVLSGGRAGRRGRR